jgi:hypothetical protein
VANARRALEFVRSELDGQARFEQSRIGIPTDACCSLNVWPRVAASGFAEISVSPAYPQAKATIMDRSQNQTAKKKPGLRRAFSCCLARSRSY